ncbi:unnamed protein product [Staurois parvus]|uniref:Uncharacterized protein n=1 Tax=Staurois parvus TaxID=386267 RepID=A0ABN9AJJ2_9NEOB|nr:unnamed protein product [Staurois parvus]
MHGAYSETWWWQCPPVGLVLLVPGSCTSLMDLEFTDVLLYIEREDATITPCPWLSCTFPT